MGIKKFFLNNIFYFIGAMVGGIGGFFYWKFVGCASGTCRITSSPVNSTVYFAMLGALTFSLLKKNTK